MQSKASKKNAPKWFPWLFIIIGVVIIGVGANLVFQSVRCRSWPTTVGTIRTARMGQHSSNKGGNTYSADISYGYSVGDTRYLGTKVAFGMMSASSSYAGGVLKRYPVGAEVPVYYSPNNPGTAVLEPGIHGGAWICFGVGGVFALFGIMFLQMQTRQTNANEAGVADATDLTRMNAPPKLMGVIAIIFGFFPIFAGRTSGNNAIIGYAAGGMFCLVGGFILTYRPGQNRWTRFLGSTISIVMLGIFHWVAFGGLGKIEPVAAVIVSGVDLVILLVTGRWLFNCTKVKARGL
ncbi:MAG: hypothetical protein JWO95_1554 [Verrucomicrobiales bacterium]|nr:hypothetical protein [Verrucomicrobiales bacterium]